MAAALPVITAFGTVAQAGSLAAAMATVNGFLTVAGGVLAGIGVLTNDKDLSKLGGILGLGGAAAGSLGFGAQAAAETADVASAGLQGLDSAAGEVAGISSAGASGLAGGEAASTGSLFEQAASRAGQAAPAGLAEATSAATQAPSLGGVTLDPLQEAAQAQTQESLQSTLKSINEKARAASTSLGDAINPIGQHIRNNKELYQLGGGILQGMYGPQAEQLDWEKSLIGRRLRNLNQQVQLGTTRGG